MLDLVPMAKSPASRMAVLALITATLAAALPLVRSPITLIRASLVVSTESSARLPREAMKMLPVE